MSPIADSGTVVQIDPVGLAANARYRQGGTEAFIDRVLERLPLRLTDVDLLVSGTDESFTDELVARAERGDLPAPVTRRFHRWSRFLNDDDVRTAAAQRADGLGGVPSELPDPATADLNSIDDAWKRAAQEKAVATMDHYLGDDWYEQYPDVDHRVLVHDGSQSGLDRVAHGRGINEWVDNGDGSVRSTIDLNLSDAILWARFYVDIGKIDSVDDLEAGQAEELTPGQRDALGLSSDHVDSGNEAPIAD
jgi:hypothetical protein